MPDRRIANIIEQTIDYAVGENAVDDIVGQPIIPWMARAHSVIPEWWSYARDLYLRDFWKKSSHLSTLMYTAQTLLANTPMIVEARDPSITFHVEQAEMYNELLWKASEFGETLFAAKERFAEDYLAQDNGSFLEVIGDGRPDGPIVGPPLAVRHLDAQYCMRTRNPTFPVIYYDPNDNGKAYKLHNSRVIYMSQMTSTETLRNGVGFSAVSRSLQFAQHLYDIYIYKQEKLGSRPISKLLVGAGFRGSQIMRAVMTANEVMNNQNLSRYSKIVGIGSSDTTASLTSVDLNDFDPFDESVSVNFAMYGLAAAFGVPIQEVWPTSGGRSGRSGDMQESRQRGKLPAEFNAQLCMQLSRKYLPPYLTVVADWRDDYQDERRAVNQDIRARNRERNIGNAAVSLRVARQEMVTVGDLTRDQYLELELEDGRLEDGSPVEILFYTTDKSIKKYLDLGVDKPTDTANNDKETIVNAISEKRAEVHAELAQTSSARKKKKLLAVLSALDRLEQIYEDVPEEVPEALQEYEDGLDSGGQEPGDEEVADGEQPAEGEQEAGEQEPAEGSEQENKPQGRTPDESREATVEGGAHKQKQINDSNFLEFLIVMESELEKEFKKDDASKSAIKKIVMGWLLLAYLEGIGKSEDELTVREMDDIVEQQELFLLQLDKIMDRKASGNDMVATINRLVNQASRLFWLGFVKASNKEQELRWVLGATKEHCSDCAGAAGKVKPKSEWLRGGLLPQSAGLECTGINCACYFEEVNE